MKKKIFALILATATILSFSPNVRSETMTHEKWAKELIKYLAFDNSPGISIMVPNR